KQQSQIGKEILGVPTNEKTHRQTDKIPPQQESISGKACKRLRGSVLFTGNRIVNVIRLISIVSKILAQPTYQVPDTNHKQSYQNGSSDDVERLPKRRLDHSHKESRQKERYGCKHGPLSLQVLAPVRLKNLIYDSVPTSLSSNIPCPLRMWII